jgi:hypothetical protein
MDNTKKDKGLLMMLQWRNHKDGKPKNRVNPEEEQKIMKLNHKKAIEIVRGVSYDEIKQKTTR